MCMFLHKKGSHTEEMLKSGRKQRCLAAPYTSLSRDALDDEKTPCRKQQHLVRLQSKKQGVLSQS